MLEGDELMIHVEGRPESITVAPIGCTWVTCRNGDHVWWIACHFQGIEAGKTYKIITRMIRDRDNAVIRVDADLACEQDAIHYHERYVLESRLGHWRIYPH